MICMYTENVKSFGPVFKYVQENKIEDVLFKYTSDKWVIDGPYSDELKAVLIVEGFKETYGG